MFWRLGRFHFEFPRRPIVMGVLNVTPDSFSDGGSFQGPEAVTQRAWAMVDEGAEIVDIGGESTRPGAEPVDEADELRRILPVLERLLPGFPVPISIDTRKPGVAKVAIDCGASLVNDIGAAIQVSQMWEVVGKAQVGYVAMHMQGTPDTMQIAPCYQDVVKEIGAFFEKCLSDLEKSGVAADQVGLDPGIGFGKTVQQNLQLLTHLNRYSHYRRPLVIGVSRKSFLGHFAGGGPLNRLPAALACSLRAADQGCATFRTHDVRETVQAMRMWEALALSERREGTRA